MGNPVTQFQIIAKAPDQAAEFYGKLFGWSINSDNAIGYRVINTGSDNGIHGGIWPSPPEGHAMVQLFVQVENVKSMVERAVDLGAEIIIPPQMLPDGDEMAVVLDPEGIPVGIAKTK